jgi:hypothetical protein
MFFFNYFLPYGRIDRPWPQIGECSASSFDWWLVLKKSTVLEEKYCWLIN